MPSKVTIKQILFVLFALFFVGSAIFHTVGFFDPTLRPGYPSWRHALFAGLNVAAAFLILRRPLLAIPFFALATVQQVYSHGSNLLRVWNEQHTINWVDIVVIVLVPTVFVLVTLDVLARRKEEGG